MERKNVLFLNSDISVGIVEFDTYYVTVEQRNTNSNINDFGLSIITIKSFRFDKDQPHGSGSRNCIRRKAEIMTSLNEGKTICLFVEKVDNLLLMILEELDISCRNIQDYTKPLKTDLLKFENIVDRFCHFTASYTSSEITPICSYGGDISGFYLPVSKGKLYVLPVVLKDYSETYYKPLLDYLFKDLSSVGSEYRLPDYLKKSFILEQKKIIDEKEKLLKRIEGIDLTLSDYEKVKSILVLKHDILVDKVCFVFEQIGIDVYRLEKYEEDLWILENGNKEVILEVKGTKGNFTRKYLNDLDTHRDENKLEDDFPALLIVNTFSEADSFEEKDVAPVRDSLKRAKAQNIMLMRTLDLYNLYLLIKEGKIRKDSFLKIIKNKDCGWIKVTDKQIEVIVDE